MLPCSPFSMSKLLNYPFRGFLKQEKTEEKKMIDVHFSKNDPHRFN